MCQLVLLSPSPTEGWRSTLTTCRPCAAWWGCRPRRSSTRTRSEGTCGISARGRGGGVGSRGLAAVADHAPHKNLPLAAMNDKTPGARSSWRSPLPFPPLPFLASAPAHRNHVTRLTLGVAPAKEPMVKQMPPTRKPTYLQQPARAISVLLAHSISRAEVVKGMYPVGAAGRARRADACSQRTSAKCRRCRGCGPRRGAGAAACERAERELGRQIVEDRLLAPPRVPGRQFLLSPSPVEEPQPPAHARDAPLVHVPVLGCARRAVVWRKGRSSDGGEGGCTHNAPQSSKAGAHRARAALPPRGSAARRRTGP